MRRSWTDQVLEVPADERIGADHRGEGHVEGVDARGRRDDLRRQVGLGERRGLGRRIHALRELDPVGADASGPNPCRQGTRPDASLVSWGACAGGERWATTGRRRGSLFHTDRGRDPETGFHYFGARHYDPWIGRFLSQDPELIGPSAGITFRRIEGDGQKGNGYAYVLNRPTRLIDPTGRAGADIQVMVATAEVTQESETSGPVGPPMLQVSGVPGGAATGLSPIGGGVQGGGG